MTTHLVTAIGVFLACYGLNMLYITVFYHRGLTHGAVELRPPTLRVVAATGNWVTGLDPLGWVCMHRLHHRYADGPDDPHSPRNVGILGVALAQLRSYERALVKLMRGDPEYNAVVADLDFGVNVLNRRGLWWLPYLVHAGVAAALSLGTGLWALGPAYFAGMMSHPVQGFLVNSFGHAKGSRNFDTPDDSRNNHLVAWLIWGEGFQNNHHAFPGSARFSYRRGEVDGGYALCRLLQAMRLLVIRRDALIPRPAVYVRPAVTARSAAAPHPASPSAPSQRMPPLAAAE